MINNEYNTNVYSENETIVGQWIDGKPIYQKTVEIPWSGNINEGTELYRFVNEAQNIDTAVSCEVCCTANSGENKDFDSYKCITVRTDGDDVIIAGTYHVNGIANVKATYRYTKTTDTVS